MGLVIVVLLIVGFNYINDINDYKYEIKSCENKLDYSEDRVDELKDRVKEEINNSKNEIDSLKRIQEIKISGMSAIDYSPSLSEVKMIIRNSDLEDEEYDEDLFNCVEFSHNLVREFKEEKIYSCITEIWFEDEGGHANVAINTSDKGLVYIEPQDDTIIYDLEVGDNYCDKVNWDCDWIIEYIKTCYF